MRHSCTRLFSVSLRHAIAFLLVAAVIGTASADESDAFSKSVLEATGIINVEWRSMGEFYPRKGFGFYVHPDGYVLTSLDVVDDPARASGQQRSSSRLVLMTFFPFGDRGRELPVTVVSSSRRWNLALLKVNVEDAPFLQTASAYDLATGDPVWVVDSGRLQRAEVRLIERNKKNREIGFGIDLLEVKGSQGSAIVNISGEVVGVRMDADDVVSSNSRSAPARAVADFLSHNAVEVTLNPSVITDPQQPVLVDLLPVMVVGTVTSGSVEMQIDDATTRVDLTNEGGRWKGSLQPPALQAEPGGDENEARLTFFLNGEDGAVLWKRRAKIDVVALDSKFRSGSDAPALQQRELNLGDKAEGVEKVVEEKKPDSISKVAGGVSLKKNERGVAKIDDKAVMDASAVRLDPTRYEKLADKTLRSLAERFDKTALKLLRAENALGLIEGDSAADPQDRQRSRAEIDELEIQRGKLAIQIQEAGICQCHERLWFTCGDAKCDISRFQSGIETWADRARSQNAASVLRALMDQ